MTAEPIKSDASTAATATHAVTSLPAPARRRPRYEVLRPFQKQLLWAIFALVALVGANSAYLASVKVLGWWTGVPAEQWFYGWMVLFHLLFGLVLAVPLVVFAVTHWRT